MTHPARECVWLPHWPRHYDDGCGLVENFCRTLHMAAMGGEDGWALLAQDDVELLPGLEDELPSILAAAPTGVVSFFSMRPVDDVRQMHRGVRWRMRKRGELLWVMLLAVRVELVPALLAGVRAGDGPHDDERLSRWLDMSGVGACWHLPNLVQHRGEQSITGKAWRMMGRPRISPTYPDGRHASEFVP